MMRPTACSTWSYSVRLTVTAPGGRHHRHAKRLVAPLQHIARRLYQKCLWQREEALECVQPPRKASERKRALLVSSGPLRQFLKGGRWWSSGSAAADLPRRRASAPAAVVPQHGEAIAPDEWSSETDSSSDD